MFHFNTFWKRLKTIGFLTFPGGIEMEHLLELGYSSDLKLAD